MADIRIFIDSNDLHEIRELLRKKEAPYRNQYDFIREGILEHIKNFKKAGTSE